MLARVATVTWRHPSHILFEEANTYMLGHNARPVQALHILLLWLLSLTKIWIIFGWLWFYMLGFEGILLRQTLNYHPSATVAGDGQ